MMLKMKSKSGSIFVTTLVTLFLMVLVGGSAFVLTNSHLHYFNRLKKSTQAQYLAEAGLAHAFGNLNSTWTTSASYPTTAMGPGTYQATVSTTSGRTLVRSVGTVQGIQRTVSAEVTEPTISALNYLLCG